MTKEERREYNKAYRESHKEYYKKYHKEYYTPKKKEIAYPYSNNVFEVWSDINDDYCVSNYGRVWNKRHKRFVGYKNGMGYFEVLIDGKAYLVHRLVAKAFIPNPENFPEIDHIDTDKTNNIYTNLRWTDRKGNQNNPITREKMKESNKGKIEAAHKASSEARRKRVIQYNKDGNFIREYESVTAAAKAVGCCKTSILDCCRGVKNVKTIKGYVWRFEN